MYCARSAEINPEEDIVVPPLSSFINLSCLQDRRARVNIDLSMVVWNRRRMSHITAGYVFVSIFSFNIHDD